MARSAMLVVLLLLVLSCALGDDSAPQNPYLTQNTTVCPGRFTVHGFQPCSGHGICLPSGECDCDRGLYHGPSCAQSLKSRKTAFLLSFLLGTTGAGRLYLGLVGTAILQLLCFTFLAVLPCFPLCAMCTTGDQSRLRKLFRWLVLCAIVGMLGQLLLWTLDWLLILREDDIPMQSKLDGLASAHVLLKHSLL